MKALTEEMIEREHARLWSELETKYGSAFSVPSDEMAKVSEILRGMYVIQLWQREATAGRSPRGFLSTYSISEETTKYLIAKLGFHDSEPKKQEIAAKPETRKSKWGVFEKWAREHRGEQFTTEQLVEQSGFSYQTTLKHVSESPIFTKVKKGLWNVASAERE